MFASPYVLCGYNEGGSRHCYILLETMNKWVQSLLRTVRQCLLKYKKYILLPQQINCQEYFLWRNVHTKNMYKDIVALFVLAKLKNTVRVH